MMKAKVRCAHGRLWYRECMMCAEQSKLIKAEIRWLDWSKARIMSLASAYPPLSVRVDVHAKD